MKYHHDGIGDSHIYTFSPACPSKLQSHPSHLTFDLWCHADISDLACLKYLLSFLSTAALWTPSTGCFPMLSTHTSHKDPKPFQARNVVSQHAGFSVSPLFKSHPSGPSSSVVSKGILKHKSFHFPVPSLLMIAHLFQDKTTLLGVTELWSLSVSPFKLVWAGPSLSFLPSTQGLWTGSLKCSLPCDGNPSCKICLDATSFEKRMINKFW